MADLDLTALNAALGAYYRQNKKAVMSKLYTQEDARKNFQVVTGVQDEYVMTEMEVTEMMQPYQEGWTPKGAVEFKPEIIKNRPVKVDFPFTPKKMEATWLGYLKTNGSSAEEYPFVQYIYEKIVEKLVRDINRCVMQGVYVAPTAGVAGGALTSFDGIIEVTKKAIIAGKISSIITGALSDANIVANVEKMVDGVDEEFRNHDLVLIMSPTWKTKYFRARRGAFGQNTDYTAEKHVVDFTNCEILAPTYFTGDGMIITKKENLLMLEDGINEEEKITVQANRRQLEVMIDFKRAVGFGIVEGQVWANDQFGIA